MQPLKHPSVRRIARIAAALGDLLPDIVFIGGAIAPLLHTDSPFDEPRPTKDADAIVATTSYADVGTLQEQLRERGFRQDPGDQSHVHRWRSPQGDILDLVPTGPHLGGSGQEWDGIALETSSEIDLGLGEKVRFASAPAFLALKFAAYADRGAEDPFGSHDLEDIIALMAARPSILGEIREGPRIIRTFMKDAVTRLVQRSDLEDLLAAHLNNAQDPATVSRRVLSRFREITDLDRNS